jgi:hypothetical protein
LLLNKLRNVTLKKFLNMTLTFCCDLSDCRTDAIVDLMVAPKPKLNYFSTQLST